MLLRVSVFGLSQLAQAIFMKSTESSGTITYSTTELSVFGELIVCFARHRSRFAAFVAGL